MVTLSLMLAPGAWAGEKFTVLHAFGKGNDGASPFDNVVLDAKGNLYGTTRGGGIYGYGTVFFLRPGGSGKWTETVLHSFCAPPDCTDGALPIIPAWPLMLSAICTETAIPRHSK